MSVTVRRQLVGGPADGMVVTADQDASVYLVPGWPTSFRTGTGPFTATVEYESETIPYRLATAPTGEVVFLAPGAVYPQRFDTAEWVKREAPHLRDLHHVAPWTWRGRAAWPNGADPGAYQYTRPWEYIGISACGRYKLRQRVSDTGRRNLGEFANADAYYTRDIRYKLAYTQLPNCPEFDCDEKAIATVIPRESGHQLYGDSLGARERFALCREHVRTVTMLCRELTPGPDVIDREGNPHVDPRDDPHHRMHARHHSALWGYGAKLLLDDLRAPFRITDV